MRLGIDARLPYYQMGGISQYVVHLLAALAALDSQNDYVVAQRRGDTRTYAPAQANFRRVDVRTPCHHRWERWALSAELLPLRLDSWHSPDFIPPQRGARRHVITVHDLNFLTYPHYLTADSRRYYNDQIAWAVQRADAIAADSEYTRQELIDRLGVAPAKVRAIPLAANAVYQQAVSAETTRQLLAQHQLPPGFILFVGTLEPRKNLPTLLEAYHRLRQTGAIDDVPLVLVGRRGWLWEGIFEHIARLGLTEQVRHLSGIDDLSLAHLYHAAGVLALPSHYEGFGLPPLEAMHCGCPVVCSRRASLPEVVGEAGVLLEPDAVDEWAEALRRVLGDSAWRAELRQRGYAQAQRFTWERTARLTWELYQC